MIAPTVTFANVQKSYDGETLIVKNLNFDIAQGEFLTMLGPSGSGKTTTLMMLAGFETATRGEIFLKGNPIGKLPAHKRGIGMVFQNYALFPHMTVHENLAYPLRVRRLPRAEIDARVRRVLSMIELPNFGERRPAQLSGGQQQRVAVGRALIFNPDLVLMDEPLGALDKKLRDEMQLEIKRLHTELGITVLYVTHDQEEAMVMSDRICLMNDARIEQLGSPADLYFRPRTLFAAGFLGESNILDATLQGVENGRAVLALNGGGRLTAPMREGATVGHQVKLMVRPECLSVLGDGQRADNEIAASLKDVIMVGGVTKHYALLADGKQVVATRLTSGPVHAAGGVGAALRLGWGADSAVLLP